MPAYTISSPKLSAQVCSKICSQICDILISYSMARSCDNEGIRLSFEQINSTAVRGILSVPLSSIMSRIWCISQGIGI